MQYITIDELVTFPAPLEVDRELYEIDGTNEEVREFPAPLEVDRYLYLMIIIIGKSGSGFPAPREVVR